MHFDSHPSFKAGDEESLEVQLWTKLAEEGLLVAPGWFFAADDGVNDAGQGHFRISFSNAEVSLHDILRLSVTDVLVRQFSQMKKAVKIFGKITKEFFKEH